MNTIKLRESSILHVPIQNYEHDFKFIINNETFQTSRLFADLLSPNISKLHEVDPTIEEYHINTKSPGNFNTILKLLSFKEEQLSTNEIEFVIEILENIGNTTDIECKINENKEETDEINQPISMVLKSLNFHQKYPNFYKTKISNEIDIISSRFYEMNEEAKNTFKALNFNIIEEIIGNSKLLIKSEDEIVELILDLSQKDIIYSRLFSYVYFVNVSSDMMKKFVSYITPDELTRESWISISERLSCEIIKPENEISNQPRYKQQNQILTKAKNIEFTNSPFEGIIDYFNKNSKLKDEVNISASSQYSSNDQWRVIKKEINLSSFVSNIEKEPWICFEFKKHKIIPKHYTIRSGADLDNPRNFVFEGSNDGNEWDVLDIVRECADLKPKCSVKTFSIKKENLKPFKFLRLRHIDDNWQNRSRLQIRFLEIFGYIF